MVEEKNNCKIISVYSPKGGAGTTTIAINLAASLGYTVKKDILLFSIHSKYVKDLDSFFDISFKYYFSKLNLDKITEVSLPSYVNLYTFYKKYNFSILPLLESSEDRSLISVKKMEQFFNIARKAFDYIIINAPADFNDQTITAFDYSHMILLVTEPTIPGIIRVKESIAMFQKKLYPMELIKLVINSSDIKNGLKREQIAKALQMDVFHAWPYDPEELVNSVQLGKPLMELNPKAAFSKSMMDLAELLDKGAREENKLNLFSIVSDVVRKKHKAEVVDEDTGIQEITEEEKKAQQTHIYDQTKQNIHRKLVTEIHIDASMDKERLIVETRRVIEKLMMEEKEAPKDRETREQLLKEIQDEALGLGPLEPLLKDEAITEIMVISKNETYIEKKGKLQLTDIRFLSNDQLLKFAERIVTPLGRRIDDNSPYVDARLADGSRVHIIIPPLAIKGPTITIRKFSKEKLQPKDLMRFNSATEQMMQFIQWCVLIRKNIVISGGTGSGKTTLLNITSGYIPHDERIVTVEDSAELQLQQPHWVRLESRPPSIEGSGEVTIRDLVKCCLRMRPDRIVVGECRSGEALDMLQAMNTGHDGSLTTVHSNSPRDSIRRLETLCLMAGMDLPARAIREQIASAVQLIIQQARLSDGSRKIINITEVTGMEGDVVTLQDLFVFKQTGIGTDGKVEGHFTPTGQVPTFIQELKSKGIQFDPKLFRPVDG